MKTIYAISFDGVPLSGITVEFLKIANIFNNHGYKIYLDLGYDIKADKNNFFHRYTQTDRLFFPEWITLTRIEGLDKIAGYNQVFVSDFFEELFASNKPIQTLHLNEKIIETISNLILNTWRQLEINFVIVENGTLPENIHFTKALLIAIDKYGKEKKLGKYVFWRDHDLMWSSETTKKKYGHSPYPETPQPINSSFIQNIVLHTADYEKTKEWIPNSAPAIISNSFCYNEKRRSQTNSDFRDHYNIPHDALLLSRYTRIIPQKRIDRDIHLLASLIRLFKQNHLDKEIYLFVVGNLNEDIHETQRLLSMIRELNIEDYIIFENGLLPYNHHLFFPPTCVSEQKQYSINDLLACTDLACFLTSYDYESYGNPIGEAVAAKVPYATTTYSRYHHVYGSKGLQGILLTINKNNDHMTIINDEFVNAVFELLSDKNKQKNIIQNNYQIAKKHFSLATLERKIKLLFNL